uniref:toxin VasX n=1 Tax=Thaumasiovibrio sp. DFM-14 TaxID=3384792 RepID=UPI0039A36703
MSSEEKSYPFPPEHSMYWEQPEREMSYAQAVEAFEAQTPQEKKMRQNPVTTKKPVVAQMPAPTFEYPADEPMRAIVPVRYAFDSLGVSPFPDPDLDIGFKKGQRYLKTIEPMRELLNGWIYPSSHALNIPTNKSEESAENCSSNLKWPHILRQLRDGYVYVYEERCGVLDEYQLEGHHFTHTETEQSASCLHYPVSAPLFIMFSPVQLTERLKHELRFMPKSRNRWMQRLSVSSIHNTGGLETLDTLVADMQPDLPHDFTHSSTPLVEVDVTTDAPIEGINYVEVACKAATSPSDWTADIADDQPAVVVALEDPLADLQDAAMAMLSALVEQCALTDDEETARKLSMARLTRDIAFVTIDKQDWPYSTVTKQNYYQFEKDVNAYLDAHYLYNREAAAILLLGAMEAGATEYSLTKQRMEQREAHLGEVWQFYPAKRQTKKNYYFEYRNKIKLKQQVDSRGLREFCDTIEPDLNKAEFKGEAWADMLLNMFQGLGDDMGRLGFDVQSREGQISFLILICQTAPTLVHLAQDEGQQQRLHNLLNGDDNLLGLAPFGGSKALKMALDSATVSNAVFKDVSDYGNLISRIGETQSFFHHDEIKNHPWIKGLSQSSHAVLSGLRQGIEAVGTGVWDSVVSAIVPVQVSQNGKFQGVYEFRALFMENALHNTIGLSADYSDKIQDFKSRLQTAEDTLNSAKNKLNVYETSNPDLNNSQPQSRANSRASAAERQRVENQKKRGGIKTRLQRTVQEAEDAVDNILGEKPALVIYKNQALQYQMESAFKAVPRNLASQTSRGASAAYAEFTNMGGVGSVAMLLNLINLGSVSDKLTAMPVDSSERREVMFELGYSLSWTLSSMADVMRGHVQNHLVNTGGDTLIKATFEQINDKTRFATSRRNVHYFRGLVAAASAAGFVAAGLETWRVVLKINSADTNIEKLLLSAQAAALSAQGIAYGGQFLRVLRGTTTIKTVAAAWMTTTLFVAGLVILGTALLLNWLKKSPFEKWLRDSIWGRNGPQWARDEELLRYDQVVNTPAVSIDIKTQTSSLTAMSYNSAPRVIKTVTIMFPE